MHKIQDNYKVVDNIRVNQAYRRLVIEAPRLAKKMLPGQFVHIKVNDALQPLFRRPFSVYRANGRRIEIFFEPVGQGSRILANAKSGDLLNILGPLGRPFTMPDKSVKDIVFVAGGIGVAPFMIFSDAIRRHKARKVLLFGARTRAHTFSLGEFRKNGVTPFVSTDDGTVGYKGRISGLFDKISLNVDSTMIYTCGPRPMMAAVQAFAKEYGLNGEASCEEVMACGLGACLGCSIPTKQGYRTVCHDGPVFPLQEVIF